MIAFTHISQIIHEKLRNSSQPVVDVPPVGHSWLLTILYDVDLIWCSNSQIVQRLTTDLNSSISTTFGWTFIRYGLFLNLAYRSAKKNSLESFKKVIIDSDSPYSTIFDQTLWKWSVFQNIYFLIENTWSKYWKYDDRFGFSILDNLHSDDV